VLTDTVNINYSIDLRLVSDLVGAPIDEVEALNPSLLRMETPPDTPFDLHLPAGTATLFEQRAVLIPETKRTAWRYHTVVAGDTLDSVAEEYRVSVAELARANQLTAGGGMSGTEALVIPLAPVAAPSVQTRLYVTRRGDTLVTIADRFGVSLTELRRWNGISSGVRVEPGRRLHVAEPAPVTHVTSSHHRRSSTSAEQAEVATHSKSTPVAASHARSGAEHSAAATSAHKPAATTAHRTHSGTSNTASSGRSSTAHKPGGTAKTSQQ
jgi:membrane-bound lytic murein transglycosylase D